jgi:hypothetical protein
LGDISGAAPLLGLARHAQPGPVLSTPWVNKMTVARMSALALAKGNPLNGEPIFGASYSQPGLGPPAPRFGASTGLGGNRPRSRAARGGERLCVTAGGGRFSRCARMPGDLRGDGGQGMGAPWPLSGYARTRERDGG